MWKYTPNFIPNKVIVVGCGGTGSRVVPLVAQFLKSCPWVMNLEFLLVDFDTVENKNLARQNFISLDIDENKASVLVSRYGRAYDIPMRFTADKDPLNDVEKTCQEWTNQGARNLMVILCVDNAAARLMYARYVAQLRSRGLNVLLIDTGNENTFGQVIFSTTNIVRIEYSYGKLLHRIPNDFPISVDLPEIPTDIEYFTRQVAASEVSCADLDQTMAINNLVAAAVLSVVQNFYYIKPFSYNRINVTLESGSYTENFNTSKLEQFLDYSKNSEKYGLDSGENLEFLRTDYGLDSAVIKGYDEINKFYRSCGMPSLEELEKKRALEKRALKTKVSVEALEASEKELKFDRKGISSALKTLVQSGFEPTIEVSFDVDEAVPA